MFNKFMLAGFVDSIELGGIHGQETAELVISPVDDDSTREPLTIKCFKRTAQKAAELVQDDVVFIEGWLDARAAKNSNSVYIQLRAEYIYKVDMEITEAQIRGEAQKLVRQMLQERLG